MNSMLESLRSYFDNNSIEEIKEVWEELDKYDKVGPTFKEYMDNTNKMQYHTFDLSIKILENNINNPKFASDFFLFSHLEKKIKTKNEQSSIFFRKLQVR